MKNELMLSIDNGYLLLKKLTDDNTAKDLFEKYLLDETIDKELDRIKLKVSFNNITKYDLISQVAMHALIYSCASNSIPLNDNYINFKNHLLESNIEYGKVVDYLMNNKEELKNIIKSFVEQRYNDKCKYRVFSDVKDKKIKTYITYLEPTGKSNYKPSLIGRISNFAFNRCRKDVLLNNQFKINNKNYSLGKELYASIDRGNEFLSLDDGVLISKHPDDKDYKIMIVADGNSAFHNKEKASNYALKQLLKWFENLPPMILNDSNRLKYLLENKLNCINLDLSNNKDKRNTTIAVALIGKFKTIISTIGNTRLYQIKDNKIIYETKDDSYVQLLCDKGLADPKYARFHKANDILSESLGNIDESSNIINDNTKIIDNNYDKLLILSDGVTKLVDNKKIEEIIEKNDSEKITKKLIEIAKNENLEMDGINNWCNSVNMAGQNNVTAAMYVKRI